MRVYEVSRDGFTFRLEEAQEGGFVATVPDLEGCISDGNTLDEAVANIEEAMALYIGASIELGLTVAREVPQRFCAASTRFTLPQRSRWERRCKAS
jgi:predicted RNase H-like HicB family nuclease